MLSPRRCASSGRVAAVLVVCGAVPLGAQQADASNPPLLVHGAASLSAVLPVVLGDAGPPVRFSFDSSSRLASIISDGAPGDVFVSADAEWVSWLAERGAADEAESRVVATNRLVVATRSGSAHGVSTFDDFLRMPPRGVAIAGEYVPAGRYAEAALRSAGVWDQLGDRVLRGASARATAEWVAAGDVAIGVLYRTDVASDARLEELFLVPDSMHPPIEYVAVPLQRSRNPEAAQSLVRDLEEARLAWAVFGFGGTGQTAAPRAPPAVGMSLRDAVIRSVVVGLLATLLALLPALGLGWVLARRDFPGKSVVSTLTLVPLVVPPVVTGFLLLWAFGARSPFGRMLSTIGLDVPFTLLGAVVAAAVVGFPLYVLTIRAAFESIDRRYEDLAATLGDPPFKRFRRISLPLALPGIIAAALLAFARGLGEFGATIVLAGNLEGSTRTIPLAVYTLLESPAGRGQIWTLVGASIGLCLVALVGFELLNKRLLQRNGAWRG